MQTVLVTAALACLASCASAPLPVADDMPEHPTIQWIDVSCENGRIASGRAILLPGRNAVAITIVVDNRICTGSI